MRLVFATGNQRKIDEAHSVLDGFDIEFQPIKLDIDEIQHEDPAEIVKAKALAAYDSILQDNFADGESDFPAVVVSDTSWSIPALGGFPGGYMKDISTWWQADDWAKIMSRHDDKTIYCLEHVAYYDGDNLQHFVSEYKGKMITEPRGRIDPYESFERVTVMYGDKTMAEYLELNQLASAGDELKHWQQFGEWYKNHVA